MENFKNEYLEIKVLDSTTFEVNFCGHTTKHGSSAEYIPKNFECVKNKRIGAYKLIPDGCKVIPRNLSPLLDGLFIGGVLEDSLLVVYGLGKNGRGIHGYSCSVFFVPNEDAIKSITDYSSLRGEFHIKQAKDKK